MLCGVYTTNEMSERSRISVMNIDLFKTKTEKICLFSYNIMSQCFIPLNASANIYLFIEEVIYVK